MEIQATRSQLLEIQKKIILSRRGYSLLKMKRDGLILEFMKILKEAKGLRNELIDNFVSTRKSIAVAESVEGMAHVESLINSLKFSPAIEISEKNMMGVRVPSIKVLDKPVPFEERGYGIIGTSIRMDNAIDSALKLLKLIEKAAEVETSLRKLLDEIEKVKRRVNALEFIVIPNLEEAQAFIKLRLEEMERENTFRLKRMKGKVL